MCLAGLQLHRPILHRHVSSWLLSRRSPFPINVAVITLTCLHGNKPAALCRLACPVTSHSQKIRHFASFCGVYKIVLVMSERWVLCCLTPLHFPSHFRLFSQIFLLEFISEGKRKCVHKEKVVSACFVPLTTMRISFIFCTGLCILIIVRRI